MAVQDYLMMAGAVVPLAHSWLRLWFRCRLLRTAASMPAGTQVRDEQLMVTVGGRPS